MRFAVLTCLSFALAGSVAANPAATQALNAIRAAKNRAPVVYSKTLEAAARAHARDMARHGFFSHKGRDGSSVVERVNSQGYRWCFLAENIAKGQRDLAEVMRAWRTSRSHRENMLNRAATEFAMVEEKNNIWVMVLANPNC